MDMVLTALCLAYLISLLPRNGRPGSRALLHGAMEIRRLPGYRKPVLRSLAGFVIGAGLAWSLGLLDPDFGTLPVLLLPVLMLCERWVLVKRGADLPEMVGFLTLMQEQAAAGSDFFAALEAAAPQLLQNGMHRKSVDRALERFAARQTLVECLSPLVSTGGYLRAMAVDVLDSGWESSQALAVTLQSLARRVRRDWEHGRTLREIRNRVTHACPWLRGLGAGTAAAVLGVSLHSLRSPAEAGLALALALLFWGAALPGGRLVRLGSAAALLIYFLVPLIVERTGPEPQTGAAAQGAPVRSRYAPRVSGLAPAGISAAEIPACVVRTGYAGGWATLRSGPGMAAGVVGYIQEGAGLSIIGPGADDWATGAWRQVRAPDGPEGWIYAPLCVETEP